MALINLQTNKPKLNVSNIRSPFGSGGSIPKISAGAHPQIRRPSVPIKPAKFFDAGKISQILTNVRVANNLSRHDSDINSIAGQLAEINAVMQDIGGALALDFANRITEQQQDNRALRARTSANRRSLAESSLEGVKKIGKGIGSGITGLASKTGSALGLGKILEAGKLLAAGIAINALWPQIEKIFDWSMKNLDKILLVGGGLLALNVIGGIGTLLKFGRLFTNPTVLAGLAILVSSIAAERRKKKVRQDFNKSHDDSIVTVEEFQEQNEGIEDPNKKKLKGSWWKLFLQGILEMGQTPGQMNFHDGGIVGGPTQEVAAVLERGEAVIPKELVSTLSQKPGINLIEMNLPDIRVPSNKAAKKVALPEATQVPYASSVNSANKHMTKTPEIHGIIG